MERYGDFELQRLIATGGMAEIYLAKHGGFGEFPTDASVGNSSVDASAAQFSRTVVVKRMLPQLAVRPDFVQMFLDEARLAANLSHPNIVSVFNLGEVDGSYFIAMEFVDGPHLGSLFAHSLRLRKALPIEFCVYIVARAADGLHYAHDHHDPATGNALNVVHRDISPQNILVSRDGDVKVTDFGVAKASTQQTKTRTGIIKGKVAYMSPEQCLGEVVDRRTDVFALGIVLYELLTRRRLFRDKSDLLIMQKITGEDAALPSTINKDLDAELDAICKRALARDREARYQSAAELAEALDAWLQSQHSGDARAQLQRWFEQNAVELAIGTSTSSASHHTMQVRPAPPGEGTAATPSLNSAETVMRTSSPEIRSAQEDGDELELPDRSHIEDEPTQRARAPDPGSEPDTLLGLAPALGPTDEGPITATSSPELTAIGRPSRPSLGRLPKAALIGVAVGAVAVGVALLLLRGASDTVVVRPTPSGDAGPVAAVAAVAAVTAKITVESVPAGVAIILDEDRVIGRTPFTFEHAPGVVRLQAQFNDQPPLNREVNALPGDELVVRMLAKMPLIVTSVPPNAKVRLNGELLGETPFEKPGLVDPEKPVRIKLELAGWDFAEKKLTPEAGKPLLVEMAGTRLSRPVKEVVVAPPPAPRFGLLNMRSSPWVFVKVGRDKIGSTTFLNAKVPAGRQTLLLSNPEVGINETLVVVIPEDRTLSVSVEWEKKGNDWRIKTRSIK